MSVDDLVVLRRGKGQDCERARGWQHRRRRGLLESRLRDPAGDHVGDERTDDELHQRSRHRQIRTAWQDALHFVELSGGSLVTIEIPNRQ
jgi:hypothetical protein